MRFKFLFNALLVLLSAGLVLGSVLIPRPINSRADLDSANFGYPLSFVVQDQSNMSFGLPDSEPLPKWLGLYSPWENPTTANWLTFWLNVAVVLLVLLISMRCGRRFTGKTEQQYA